ncbi:MAG TPA: helical backbone metal receptor [Vicinamibacterales bacterium]
MAPRSTRLTRVVVAVLVAIVTIAVRGEAPRAADAPKRIVSLVPALTEMLFAIGAGPQVIGVSSFDDYPPEVKSLPRVGALVDPDMERILSLRPDLVIVYGSQTTVETQLTRAGIRSYSYRHAGLAGVFATIRDLGRVVARTTESEQLAQTLQRRLDAVKTRVAKLPRVRTLLVFERDLGSLRGLYASGGIGFMHDILAIAGGTNVFADVSRESVQPSIETVLARAPDVILEVRPTGLPRESIPSEQRVWDSVASIPAVRKGQVHIVIDDYLVTPGPRVAQAAEAIARIIHPEAFK